MAGFTKADYEDLTEKVYEIADAALTPKTTRSEAIDALQAIYELTCPDDEDEDDSDDDTDGDEDE